MARWLYSSRHIGDTWNGVAMRIFSGTAPGALRLAGRGQALSPGARKRLKWMDYYEQHGKNAALTCRYFGISRQTFYRWRRRYRPQRLASLEERSRRPRRVRQPVRATRLRGALADGHHLRSLVGGLPAGLGGDHPG